MPGGRPSQGKQQRYAELEELAAWFHQALGDAGFGSVHEFLALRLFEKNAVYGVFNASRLLTLESTQSLAVALHREPGAVVDVWVRAKEGRDREAMARERAESPRLERWTDCPLPTLAVRNLLEAQAVAVDRLPYRLLGVDEPPLSTIYVRQQIRPAATAEPEEPGMPRGTADERRSAATGSQAALPVSEVLERHDHLLVTGEPGAGKSTLSNHLARVLSRVWLREDSATKAPLTEPVVPVRVSARSLDGTGSWSAVLAAAVRRTLGRTLVQDPDAGMFAGRVQGARWLVLVDGLDEIPDPRVRGDVIRTIAQHARPGSDYRFVVTTRGLPESELSPFRSAAMGGYVIQPFARAELELFARYWFTAQNLGTAKEETERFLRETSDGRLSELVRNPLLATIAAVTAVKDGARPLPTSRISLYERFCGYLAGDRDSPRDLLDDLRRHYHDDPARLACVKWLHAVRFDLLAVLARERLETQDPLWPVAQRWVREHADAVLLDGWEEHLWEELIGTGLVVANERELRFLHQSFAEFLAARFHAESIGDDFADLDAWIRRGLKDAERTFALFTFALWAAVPGHDIATVVTRLLSSYDPRRVLLAGHLVAEGVATPTAVVERVVARLVALARNSDDFDTATGALDVLGGLFDHRWAAGHLESIAEHPDLDVGRRMAAVVALERLTGDSHRVRPLLTALLPSCYSGPLRRAAPMALRLGPEVVGEVRARALAMVHEPDLGIGTRVGATEVLADLGLVAEMKEVACSVFADRQANAARLKRVLTAWHDAVGAEAIAELAAQVSARPADDHVGRLEIAAFVSRAGDRATVEQVTEAVLEDPYASMYSVQEALIQLLRLRGDDGVAAVVTMADEWIGRAEAVSVWYAGSLLKLAVDVVPHDSLAKRAWAYIEVAALNGFGLKGFVGAWLAAGTESAGKLAAILGDGRCFHPSARVEIAGHLNGVGAHASASEWAESVLRNVDFTMREWSRDMARVLLECEPATGAATLLHLAAGRPCPPVDWLRGVLDALDPEYPDAAIRIAAVLADHPRVTGAELKAALSAQVIHGDKSDAEAVAVAVVRHELSFHESRALARLLAASGEHDLAIRAWSLLLSTQENGLWNEIELVDDFRCAGVEDWARNRFNELVGDPSLAPRRRRQLRQMLAVLDVE
ncbi:hypothetical protein GCM10022243_09060 [Saccharothrix violaceirubra]|uniref:Energy-coupling factor transporter ATP-binding protein EcfA2 n=1 Tax=Saccharothrix violaceirubra TaxID=413306 RepID=A0A7W7WWR5_9PSEU|nr:hypothetical protein [Saccharothrix violaceirubra]MBB4966257.1 energy-coupling factor transporter ATP-binding protein EcfA2 [Saccharothrix violaceirubra]